MRRVPGDGGERKDWREVELYHDIWHLHETQLLSMEGVPLKERSKSTVSHLLTKDESQRAEAFAMMLEFN